MAADIIYLNFRRSLFTLLLALAGSQMQHNELFLKRRQAFIWLVGPVSVSIHLARRLSFFDG